MSEKLREAFEVWFLKEHPLFKKSDLVRENNDYTGGFIKPMYNSFKAGIELKAQQAAVPSGYVPVPVAQLIDTIHEIRSLNSGEYSKAEIEENICTIEAMVEKAQEKADV